MMTPHNLTQRLQHEWELHGSTANPTPLIRELVRRAPVRERRELADNLLDRWAQWCAEEVDDDYAV